MGMAEEQEDKYERFFRDTDIDLQAEIAAGGSGEGLVNYYTKTESDAITDALDVRITDLENAPGGGGEGVTDHGELTGLTDDDHPQYHNNARGDDRYYTKTQTDANFATAAHNHDGRYYTESEVDNLLDDKANLSELSNYAGVSSTPRYLMFNTTWPPRPDDSRMTFYIGGDPATDAPADSILGDVWIPSAEAL